MLNCVLIPLRSTSSYTACLSVRNFPLPSSSCQILKDMLGVVDSSSPRPIWCKASDKADVFAFALVLYEVWSGRDAFESPDSTLVQQIVDEQKRPPLDDAIFADCPWRGLILSCWHQDPLEVG